MKRTGALVTIVLAIALVMTACGTTSGSKDTITIAWYPNESGAELKDAREAIGKIVEETTGKKVEHLTTTDYIIAIESIANGNADLGFFGAQGYIEAKNKNDDIEPLVVPSGVSGTLDDAVYYSWLAVKNGNEDAYRDGDGFSIDNIVGKKFSFVSNSSTSGFKVPSAAIIAYFGKQDQYKDLEEEDLIESGKFFSEVQFGGSHQGAALNLLTDTSEIASFCDTCVNNYVELISGEENRTHAIYKVKEDAAEPLNTVKGEEFVLISVTPVLNAPFIVNTKTVSKEHIDKLREVLTSEEVTNNPAIFVVKDSGFTGMFAKTGDERFVVAEDSWFNPVRELSQ